MLILRPNGIGEMNRTASHSSQKETGTLVFRCSLLAACIVLSVSAAGDVQAKADPILDDGAPIHIPLTVLDQLLQIAMVANNTEQYRWTVLIQKAELGIRRFWPVFVDQLRSVR